MEPGARFGPAPDPGRDDRQGREDAVAADQVEPGTIGEPQVLGERAIPRVLQLAGGANQAAAQQEVVVAEIGAFYNMPGNNEGSTLKGPKYLTVPQNVRSGGF